MSFIKKIISFIIAYLAPISVIIFNLTNWSIINWFLEILSKPILTGSSKTAVDSAIVVIFTSIISNLFKHIGIINLKIRNLDETIQYKLPKMNSERYGKIWVDCHVIYKNKWLEKKIKKLGKLEVVIKNTEWTSLNINNRLHYNNINDDNISEEIIVNLNKNEKSYIEIAISSNVDIKKDDEIKLEVRHSNKIINKMLELLFEIHSDHLMVVYRTA